MSHSADRKVDEADSADRERRRFAVEGVVQGVGFRPFVYALSAELGLVGEVANIGAGAVAEVEGTRAALDEFGRRLVTDAPPLAIIESVTRTTTPCRGGAGFVIGPSGGEPGRTFVSPDIATCDACVAELRDPADRRYRHAFISCTHCGPRFTVIKTLPYDRPATTMAELPLCATCAREYEDPADRRFHAQTIACPDCGPTLRMHRPGGDDVVGPDAVAAAREVLARGGVVAVKGIGGYHLACDATDENAVAALRKRKDRGDKPFAVMVADADTAATFAEVSDAERALLADARRPVVLLRRRSGPTTLAASVSPDHPDIGIVLAYTPLHLLLLGLDTDVPGPEVLVMTSGNLAGEPIVIDDEAALDKLAGLADAWLTHDRPIHVPCDDSVVRVVGTATLPVRRSRGYAPLPIALPMSVRPALAVGGDAKNTFCVAAGGYAWLSAHVGDMDDLATQRALDRATIHLQELTGVAPEVLIADSHPGYRSSAWARRAAAGREVRHVQHHHAHLASAMAENGWPGGRPVIGFAFDGTGAGDDGAAWGGEVLLADYDGYTRAAHLKYVALPGGDSGVRNPCRMALSHLSGAGLDWDPRLPPVAVCGGQEGELLARQLASGFNTVPTSSMGRLFDAVSSLAGVCHRVAYEAEAAMRFEELASTVIDDVREGYRFGLAETLPMIVDPGPLVAAVVDDVLGGVDQAVIAARFHRGVCALVVSLACRERDRTGLQTVALSGGVFLNALLTRLCVTTLATQGFTVLSHRKVPPSDAGLALGQIAIGARRHPS